MRIAVHRGAEVAFAGRFERATGRPRVSQAFCSALSVAYAGGALAAWEPWARVVLDAAYEATLLAAALDREAPWGDGDGDGDGEGEGSGRVWLTFLGGGVFGNAAGWIDDAIGRAVARAGRLGLDVRVAHYRRLDPARVDAIDAAIARASPV
jgi:hypothetical protein